MRVNSTDQLAQVALTFSIVTLATGVIFISGQLSLHSPMSELEDRDEDRSD